MSAVALNPSPTGKAQKITSLVIRGLLAAAFLAAGGAKLAGVPMMVQTFDGIGIGQWFRYVTGTIEVVSAALLFLPAARVVGAELLACTMVGAVFTHVALIGGPAAPALVLLVLLLAVLWLHRSEVAALPVRIRG